LTEAPDNLLMWAHYAKNYTGFCIGFNSCHWFFSKSNDIYGNYEGDNFSVMFLSSTEKHTTSFNRFIIVLCAHN
jgi:hypothetical protein